jgi:hypothetical protein
MSAADRAATQRQGADGNRFYAKQLARQASSHDIHDGIHRADFVKMNFLRRHPMHSRFRPGQIFKNLQTHGADRRRQISGGNYLTNILKSAMRRMTAMFMRMIMTVFMIMVVVVFMIMVVIMIMVMTMTVHMFIMV